MSVLSAERVRRLSLGVPVVDDVFPGFEGSDFGVLYGEGSSLMGFVLCVRCILPPDLHGLGCDVVFVDGGNSFSPYLVSEVARGYGFDPRYVLERIYVSRAFTAYQLSALILEKLEPFIDRHDVGLVFVSDIASLFLDRDIPKREAADLFTKVCSKLADIAAKKGKIVLATYNPDRASRRGLFFEAVLFGRCNVLVRLGIKHGSLTFTLQDHPRVKPFTVELPKANLTLTKFMEEA